jgi:hypothetical protein
LVKLRNREKCPFGAFHFSNLVFADTTHVVLSAINPKGSNTIRIIYFIARHEPPKVYDLQYALPIMEDSGMSVSEGETVEVLRNAGERNRNDIATKPAILHYYNADGIGIYRVIVEGIDNYGNIGRMVYRYKVE